MPDQYAVIGNPIHHSLSPQIHAAFAQQTGQDMAYQAVLGALDGFAEAVAAFRRAGGRGMNITVPFKLEAFQLADELSPRAERAGAVNTFRFQQQKIFGDNTDGAGLVNDVQQNLGFSIQGKAVLIMGAGGAAHGVLPALIDHGPASIMIANRSPDKAMALANSYKNQADVRGGDYASLGGHRFDLIINATSSSLHDALPPLPPRLFAPGALAYDMMYGKGLTPFLAFAEANQAQSLADGLGMLVEQAAEAFYLWRGLRPQTRSVIENLRKK